MNLNEKSLDVMFYLARLLGVLPYKRAKSTTGNISFKSVLTPMYISKRLLTVTIISIMHIKFRVCDKISSKASFQTLVFVGCSTTTLLFAIAIVIMSTTVNGKKAVKLTKLFPKEWALENLTNDKKIISESHLFFAQVSYVAIVITASLVLSSFEFKVGQFLPNVCIDVYAELIIHIWIFSYFNNLLRLKMAFEDLYSASLAEDLTVAALNDCWRRYLYLRGVVVRINRTQGLNAIFCVGYIYVWQLNELYALLVELLKDEPDKRVAVSRMIWAFVQSFKLFVLIYQPPKCASLVQKFRIRLANYSSEGNHIEEVGVFFFYARR